MPCRPAIATPFFENVHLSMRGTPNMARWASAVAHTTGDSSGTTQVGK
jgi:hypothetical protein